MTGDDLVIRAPDVVDAEQIDAEQIAAVQVSGLHSIGEL